MILIVYSLLKGNINSFSKIEWTEIFNNWFLIIFILCPFIFLYELIKNFKNKTYYKEYLKKALSRTISIFRKKELQLRRGKKRGP